LHPDWNHSYVYVLWHEFLLLPAVRYADLGITVMISDSEDGDFIARFAARLGWNVVRGSSTRGAIKALRQPVELAAHGGPFSIALTADGPRGPRRELKSGAIYLATKLAMPIVPVGIAYDRPWRCRSWDRFAVPRPFSRAAVVFAKPIPIPSAIGRHEIEPLRRAVERSLCDATDQAHAWLESPAAEFPAAVERPRAA
jgi:lysophospholipid acyltransferase (LPLAT)-like uncharacterized protein